MGRGEGVRGRELIENYIHKGNYGPIDIGLFGKRAKGRGTLNVRRIRSRARANVERWGRG